MDSLFQLEIVSTSDDKSHVVIKAGNVELESKQALNAAELAELQQHIAFCNQTFKRIQ